MALHSFLKLREQCVHTSIWFNLPVRLRLVKYLVSDACRWAGICSIGAVCRTI
jgi:hypothetical protein